MLYIPVFYSIMIMFNYVPKERTSLKLKRNFITILYTIFFIAILGMNLFQIVNTTLMTLTNKYIITGIVALGIIIFMIIAFLIKEGEFLLFFENKKILPIILECLIVITCIGLLFFIRSNDSMDIAICHSVLLLSFYLVGRMLFGRLNGIFTMVIGMVLLLLMPNTPLLNDTQTISFLCFFVPYIVFLVFNRYIVTKSGFLISMSYFVLSVIFTIAIIINPLVVLMLIGCIFSLLFTHTEKAKSVLAKGIICAALLTFFSISLMVITYVLFPELIVLPSLNIDSSFPITQINGELFVFIVNKLVKAVNYISLSFPYDVIQTVLVFFSLLPAYYCIRKKFSYIGPLLFSYVGLTAYYLFFVNAGSDFYYFTYFIPILAAYGLTNTLIKEKNNSNEAERIPVDTEETSLDETVTTTQEISQPENSDISQPESPVTIMPEEIVIPSSDESEKQGEIPEWKIPSNYVESKKEVNEDIIEERDGENDLLIEENLLEEQDGEEDFGEEQEVSEDFSEEQEVNEDLLLTPPSVETDESTPDMLDIDNGRNDEEPINSLSVSEDNGFLEFTDREEDTLVSNDSEQNEDEQLDELLERLDISEHIKRMNESAQEDMADVIERDEEQVELDEALPLKPSNSTLPKYKKPNFDFKLEPINIPLDDSFSNISEYDEVPTIRDLESRWKSEEDNVVETVDVDSDVLEPTSDTNDNLEHDWILDTTKEAPIHSEEIVKKNGIGERSYHRITIR